MKNHPGKPIGSDVVPAWLTPGEFVMNAEAAKMYAPQIQAMNDHGRALQVAQGGTIPKGSDIPIPTIPNPSANYGEGGGVNFALSPEEIENMKIIALGEARGEDELGQAAVLWTMLNRGERFNKKQTEWKVADFETLKNEKSLSDYKKEDIDKVTSILDNILEGKVKDPTGGATHYYANKGPNKVEKIPDWADPSEQDNEIMRYDGLGDGIQIGNHFFTGDIGKDYDPSVSLKPPSTAMVLGVADEGVNPDDFLDLVNAIRDDTVPRIESVETSEYPDYRMGDSKKEQYDPRYLLQEEDEMNNNYSKGGKVSYLGSGSTFSSWLSSIFGGLVDEEAEEAFDQYYIDSSVPESSYYDPRSLLQPPPSNKDFRKSEEGYGIPPAVYSEMDPNDIRAFTKKAKEDFRKEEESFGVPETPQDIMDSDELYKFKLEPPARNLTSNEMFREREKGFGIPPSLEVGMDPDEFNKTTFGPNTPYVSDKANMDFRKAEEGYGIPPSLEAAMDPDQFNRTFSEIDGRGYQQYADSRIPSPNEMFRDKEKGFGIPPSFEGKIDPDQLMQFTDTIPNLYKDYADSRTATPRDMAQKFKDPRDPDFEPRRGLNLEEGSEEIRDRIGEPKAEEKYLSFVNSIGDDGLINKISKILTLEKDDFSEVDKKADQFLNKPFKEWWSKFKPEFTAEFKNKFNKPLLEDGTFTNNIQRIENINAEKQAQINAGNLSVAETKKLQREIFLNNVEKANIGTRIDNTKSYIDKKSMERVNELVEERKRAGSNPNLLEAMDREIKLLSDSVDTIQANSNIQSTDDATTVKEKLDKTDAQSVAESTANANALALSEATGTHLGADLSTEELFNYRKDLEEKKNKALQIDKDDIPKTFVEEGVSALKDAWGELFDPKSLARAAILYCAGRLCGMSGNQALSFSGQVYLTDIANTATKEKLTTHVNKLRELGQHTESSLQLYNFTGKTSDLVLKSAGQPIPTDKTSVQYITPAAQKKFKLPPKVTLRGYKIKGTGETGFMLNGRIFDITNPNIFVQDKSTVYNSPEWKEKSENNREIFQDRIQAFFDLPIYTEIKKNQKNKDTKAIESIFKQINSGTASGQLNAYANKHGLDIDTTMAIARLALANAAADSNRANTQNIFGPNSSFMDSAFAQVNVGVTDAFKISEGKNGKDPVYDDPNNIKVVLTELRELKKPDGTSLFKENMGKDLVEFSTKVVSALKEDTSAAVTWPMWSNSFRLGKGPFKSVNDKYNIDEESRNNGLTPEKAKTVELFHADLKKHPLNVGRGMSEYLKFLLWKIEEAKIFAELSN